MEYREFAPPRELEPFVRCFWTLTAEAPSEVAETEPILPDGCMELVVHWGERFERVLDDRRRLQPRAFVVGQLRSPFTVAPTGRIGVVGARFRLGGATPWLGGLAASALVEREARLDELGLGADAELCERIAEARDAGARADELARWLVARASPRRAHAAIDDVAARLENGDAPRFVDEFVARGSIGTRQLERLFAEHVGLGPKLVLRIARFQRFLAEARAARTARGVELAAAAGYADQAHLIRDFREFAGQTPNTWLARHTPIAAALAGFER
jgi:methylphosphotriester-DNA--protein-cysteine methyltransferase